MVLSFPFAAIRRIKRTSFFHHQIWYRFEWEKLVLSWLLLLDVL